MSIAKTTILGSVYIMYRARAARITVSSNIAVSRNISITCAFPREKTGVVVFFVF